ncbi:uncharacterized protein LOC134225864 [Armigeres subalbatus]|uniref:uncharacterized protein LOC134225864 n=1 Tax=Armigeres subalbatus TaxID=124917 RepID=UPI002ED47810
MRKCYFLLLLPVVFGTRPPAAVFEDVFELGRPNYAFLASPIHQNGMQAYLTKRNRQLADNSLASAGSHYRYQTAASERYQIYEETQNDRIRLENLQKIANVRTKRLDSIALPRQFRKVEVVPREMFRFTLDDAMINHKDPEGLTRESKTVKRRAKREEGRTGKRIEPVPREVFRFEAKDAITKAPETVASQEVNDHRRKKRSADPGVNKEGRETVSFELRDAKTPERDAKLFRQQVKEENPNLRMPFMTSDTFKRGSVYDEVVERPDHKKRETKNDNRDVSKDGLDLSIEESRRVKVMRGNKKKMTNYEDLPLGVQKAIDLAIKENERMNVKSAEDPTKPPKYYFGDKKPKTKKPFSSTTAKATFQPPKEAKFTPSPPVETGFVPSKAVKSDSSENLKPEKSNPATWWAASNLNRPKRLHQKASYPPLVISPQYVNTYKPTMETYKMKELSPGYDHSHENSYDYEAPKEVVVQDKPKIQYVIKEVPVPVRIKEPRTKITVKPTISISYDKEPSGPSAPQETGQLEYNNPYGPVELRYEQPKEPFQSLKIIVPDSKEQSQPSYYEGNHVEQSHAPESSHSSENYESTGSSIAALSALIGKRPTVQLKGLNELLHMPVSISGAQPLQTMKTRVRPQDSTAPIMFPVESSTPAPTLPKKTTGYRSVKIENGPKIVYEDSPNPSTLYHTVQMNPQLKVPMTKDYTPIKEVVSDISDSDIVGPTITAPTHATYIVGSTAATPTAESFGYESEAKSHGSDSYHQVHAIRSTPKTIVEPISVHYEPKEYDHKQHLHYQPQQQYDNSPEAPEHHHHDYEELGQHVRAEYHGYHENTDQHDEDNEDHDETEGYAFGYRVRDFHTGNDFGHIQNRDNGVTRGEYHILLPDGRVQNVRYTADDKGFHAEVSYESIPTPHESAPSPSIVLPPSSASSSPSSSSSASSHS